MDSESPRVMDTTTRHAPAHSPTAEKATEDPLHSPKLKRRSARGDRAPGTKTVTKVADCQYVVIPASGGAIWLEEVLVPSTGRATSNQEKNPSAPSSVILETSAEDDLPGPLRALMERHQDELKSARESLLRANSVLKKAQQQAPTLVRFASQGGPIVQEPVVGLNQADSTNCVLRCIPGKPSRNRSNGSPQTRQNQEESVHSEESNPEWDIDDSDVDADWSPDDDASEEDDDSDLSTAGPSEPLRKKARHETAKKSERAQDPMPKAPEKEQPAGSTQSALLRRAAPSQSGNFDRPKLASVVQRLEIKPFLRVSLDAPKKTAGNEPSLAGIRKTSSKRRLPSQKLEPAPKLVIKVPSGSTPQQSLPETSSPTKIAETGADDLVLLLQHQVNIQSSSVNTSRGGYKVNRRHNYTRSCPECRIYFPENVFQLHNLLKHPVNMEAWLDSLTCTGCGHEFQDHERLLKHVDKYHGKSAEELESKKAVQCPLCDHCVVCIGSHMNQTHPEDERRVSGKKDAKDCEICHKLFPYCPPKRELVDFQCVICAQRCITFSQRQRHIEDHLEKGEVKCAPCGKMMKSYSKLRNHFNQVHKARLDMKFCPVCQKACSGDDKLKVHMVVHSNEYTFCCTLCDRKFKRKNNLDNHVDLFHHKNKVDKRKEKRAKDKAEGVVNKYEGPRRRMHFDDFPYKCHECKLGYIVRGFLVNHYREHHPEKPIEEISA